MGIYRDGKWVPFGDKQAGIVTSSDQLYQQISELRKTKVRLQAEIDRMEDEWYSPSHVEAIRERTIKPLQQTIAFYASVIKSGEPWTAACQERYEHMLQTRADDADIMKKEETADDSGYLQHSDDCICRGCAGSAANLAGSSWDQQ